MRIKFDHQARRSWNSANFAIERAFRQLYRLLCLELIANNLYLARAERQQQSETH